MTRHSAHPSRTAPSRSLCVGCLDDRSCWVCQGTGMLPVLGGPTVPCRTCGGRGLCRVCRPVPAQCESGGAPG